MPNIAIPNDYFQKSGKRDYANWRWSWVRELVQNSMDCGSTRIKIEVTKQGQDTLVTFQNNGSVMDEDTLVNKLLALGATTKTDPTQTGGFGIAKIVIMLMHKSYEVHTGNLVVKGSGGEYDLTTSDDFIDGTKTTVVMEGDESEQLIEAVRAMIKYSQMGCEIELTHNLNSTVPITETLKPELRKGSPRREFSWGKVYSNKSFKNKIIVRINGVCMFQTWTAYNDCIIIELTGKSTDLLTSNRDGLLSKPSQEFNAFIGEISIDHKSALKSTAKTYMRYAGSRHRVSKKETLEISITEMLGSLSGVSTGTGVAMQAASSPRPDSATTAGEPATQGNSNKSYLDFEFILKNETDLAIPEYLMPHSDKFSKYARTLARYWANVLVEVHKLLDVSGDFAIGFVVSEECRAQYESGDYGVVYYLNPVEVIKQKSSNSRSLKTRLKLTDKDEIIASAVHEVVHGMGDEYSLHNERYANKLTDAFAIVMKNRQRLMKCFR